MTPTPQSMIEMKPAPDASAAMCACICSAEFVQDVRRHGTCNYGGCPHVSPHPLEAPDAQG